MVPNQILTLRAATELASVLCPGLAVKMGHQHDHDEEEGPGRDQAPPTRQRAPLKRLLLSSHAGATKTTEWRLFVAVFSRFQLPNSGMIVNSKDTVWQALSHGGDSRRLSACSLADKTSPLTFRLSFHQPLTGAFHHVTTSAGPSPKRPPDR